MPSPTDLWSWLNTTLSGAGTAPFQPAQPAQQPPPANVGVAQAGGLPSTSVVQDDNTNAVEPSQTQSMLDTMSRKAPPPPPQQGMLDKVLPFALPILMGLGAEIQEPRNAGPGHRLGAALSAGIPTYLSMRQQQQQMALRNAILQNQMGHQQMMEQLGLVAADQRDEKLKDFPAKDFDMFRKQFPQTPDRQTLEGMSPAYRAQYASELTRGMVAEDKPRTGQLFVNPDTGESRFVDKTAGETPPDGFVPYAKPTSGATGLESKTIYGPNGQTKQVSIDKTSGDYEPPKGWSLSKPAASKTTFHDVTKPQMINGTMYNVTYTYNPKNGKVAVRSVGPANASYYGKSFFTSTPDLPKNIPTAAQAQAALSADDMPGLDDFETVTGLGNDMGLEP